MKRIHLTKDLVKRLTNVERLLERTMGLDNENVTR
jgi:hypothetical protein